MADNTNYLENWAAKLLEQETSKEMLDLRMEMLKRIARESDIKPSRIPAPLNITEIGGYINLMMRFKKEAQKEKMEAQQAVISDMLNQMLSSILGLPMQPPMQFTDANAD